MNISTFLIIKSSVVVCLGFDFSLKLTLNFFFNLYNFLEFFRIFPNGILNVLYSPIMYNILFIYNDFFYFSLY